MSQNILFNGSVYVVPSVGDDSWGQSLSDFLVAIPQGVLQKSGGNFSLASDINFGPNFGLLAKYFSTRTVLPATSGIIRLSLADTIAWRNNANTADLALAVNGTDNLTFNGTVLQTAGNYLTGLTGDVVATGPGSVVSAISPNAVTNAHLRQSAALSIIGNATNALSNVADIVAGSDYTLLMRSGTSLAFNLITNNNIDPAAALAYSKLALTGSIVDADISATAAIAYAKLALTGSITNADLAGGIAYAKLSLTGAIQNADLAGGIAYGKLALTGAIVAADLAGSIPYTKLTLAGSLVDADISATAGIAYSKLAALTAGNILIGNGSNVPTVTAISGDATLSTGGVLTLGSNVVSNAKAAQMAAHTFKGNNTGATANPIDLTAAQLTAELNPFTGDSGAGGAKGLVPAPAAGDGAATKVLRADGTWGAAGTASPLITKGDLYTYTTTNARLPVGTDNYILTADSTQAAGIKWAAPAAGGSIAVDRFTGDGTTTAYTLSVNPGALNNTSVYIDGVYQDKNTYSLTTTTLTFTAAPPSGTTIEVISGATTAIAVPADGSVTTIKIADANVTRAKLASGSFLAPTIQKFLSGSGTYTTAAGALYIRVRMVGGGAGGTGSGTAAGTAPGSGGNTSFGTSLLTANGGVAAPFGVGPGGPGGTASLGTGPIGIALAGGDGGSVTGVNVTTVQIGGSNGGSSAFGGAGSGGSTVGPGVAGKANTGGGGGGGGNNSVANALSGQGGGAGGFVDALIMSPATTYPYSVGAGGAGGGAGTSGLAGAAGGSGLIEVTEYYQ